MQSYNLRKEYRTMQHHKGTTEDMDNKLDYIHKPDLKLTPNGIISGASC